MVLLCFILFHRRQKYCFATTFSYNCGSCFANVVGTKSIKSFFFRKSFEILYESLNLVVGFDTCCTNSGKGSFMTV